MKELHMFASAKTKNLLTKHMQKHMPRTGNIFDQIRSTSNPKLGLEFPARRQKTRLRQYEN